MARATCKNCKNIIDNNGICQACGSINEIPKEKVLLVDVIIGDNISICQETLVCNSASKYSRGFINLADRCRSLHYKLDFEI